MATKRKMLFLALVGVLLFNSLPIILTVIQVPTGLAGAYILAIVLDIIAAIILGVGWEDIWDE